MQMSGEWGCGWVGIIDHRSKHENMVVLHKVNVPWAEARCESFRYAARLYSGDLAKRSNQSNYSVFHE